MTCNAGFEPAAGQKKPLFRSGFFYACGVGK
jgi:hypothetical protein